MKDSLPQEAYNELADSYAAKIDTKPHNAYYDRPAIKTLIKNIQNHHILDAVITSYSIHYTKLYDC